VLALPVSAALVPAVLRLGYGPTASAALVAAIALGGWFDFPLMVRTVEGASSRGRLGVNLGGCLVPLGIALERSWHWPRSAYAPAVVSVFLVGALSFFLARPVAGRGVVLAWPLTGLLAAALGLLLAPARVRPSSFAFVSSLLGALIGGEVPNLPRLLRGEPVHAGIGGDGLYDGLVWSSLLASWMAMPAYS
jgi:uncharacterized membrane protein